MNKNKNKDKNFHFTNIDGKDNIVGDHNTSTKKNNGIVVIAIVAIIFSVFLAFATDKDFQVKIKDYFFVSTSEAGNK